MGIISLLAYLTFFQPVRDWDEARRGVNALLMVRNGDWWNYYYLDGFDRFNTKPPLFTWLTAGLFAAFGVSAVTLRAVSFLSSLAYLAYVYQFSAARLGRRAAGLILLILLAVDGIVGYHVALNGDVDMLFCLFLTVALFEWFTYFEHGKRKYFYWAAVAGFLALLTKGIAVFLVLPGVVAYWMISRRERVDLRLPRLGLALTGGLLVVCVLLLLYFQREGDSWTAGNLLFDMIINDGLSRGLDSSFETGYAIDFPFVALDLRFGGFVYLLYATGAYGILFRRTQLQALLRPTLVGYCFCLTFSCLSLLTLSANKHDWYVAPIIFPLAVLTITAYRNVIPSFYGRNTVPYLLAIGLVIHKLVAHDPVIPVRKLLPDDMTASNYVVSPLLDQQCVFFLYRQHPTTTVRTTFLDTTAGSYREIPYCGSLILIPD